MRINVGDDFTQLQGDFKFLPSVPGDQLALPATLIVRSSVNEPSLNAVKSPPSAGVESVQLVMVSPSVIVPSVAPAGMVILAVSTVKLVTVVEFTVTIRIRITGIAYSVIVRVKI